MELGDIEGRRKTSRTFHTPDKDDGAENIIFEACGSLIMNEAEKSIKFSNSIRSASRKHSKP
jgi:hypothetical protein